MQKPHRFLGPASRLTLERSKVVNSCVCSNAVIMPNARSDLDSAWPRRLIAIGKYDHGELGFEIPEVRRPCDPAMLDETLSVLLATNRIRIRAILAIDDDFPIASQTTSQSAACKRITFFDMAPAMRTASIHDPLDVYMRSGHVIYLALAIDTLFVQQGLWEELPDQHRLMVIMEAVNQCEAARGKDRKPLRVVDVETGILMGLEGEAY